MSPHDKIDSDAIQSDDVPYRDATDRLSAYAEARRQLASFEVPVLLHADNPHERLFVAAMDGTTNDKFHDGEHKTNVALISDQIEALNADGNYRVGYG